MKQILRIALVVWLVTSPYPKKNAASQSVLTKTDTVTTAVIPEKAKTDSLKTQYQEKAGDRDEKMDKLIKKTSSVERRAANAEKDLKEINDKYKCLEAENLLLKQQLARKSYTISSPILDSTIKEIRPLKLDTVIVKKHRKNIFQRLF